MKTLATAIATALLTLAATAQDTMPETQTETPAPREQTDDKQTDDKEPLATVGTAIQDEDTDEIDLEEDDSAIAAKKPQIKGDISEGTMSLVDIDCDEATLADILRQFRKTTGANIISDDSTNLQRRVSVSLRHVPWLQGLTAILGSRGFRLEPRDNIYRVIEDLQAIPVSTRTFALNHASAKELADLFNATFAPKDPTGKTKLQIASSFVGANVVVVTASDKILADCESIIEAVDKAVAQIYIEARFIELSTGAMHQLGMDWSKLKSWSASVKNISAGMEYNNGRVGTYGVRTGTGNMQQGISMTSDLGTERSMSAGTQTSSGSFTSYGSTALSASTKNSGSISHSFNRGRSSDTLAPTAIQDALIGGADMAWRNARGFTGQLSVDDFGIALSAFESMDEVKIFSNPKVIVSNGKEATVDMTTKFPNIELASQRNTSASSSYLDMTAKIQQIPGEDTSMFSKSCFYSWGIQLSVTPRISRDGLISVEIIPTISQLDKDVTSSGFYQVQNGDNDSSIGLFPIISLKRITTEFTMHDGSTAVIGGLSRTDEGEIDSGIPYLRKIPWIGQKLFGWKNRTKTQKEIIICVTVGIADPRDLPKDVGLPKNAILGREYVRGDKLEPGDREDTAANILALDFSDIEKRSQKKKSKPADAQKSGEVKITVVKDNMTSEASTSEPAPATIESVPATAEPAPATTEPSPAAAEPTSSTQVTSALEAIAAENAPAKVEE